MKNYKNIKEFDVVPGKNVNESEERSEPINCIYIDYQNLNSKNIHNKNKEFR